MAIEGTKLTWTFVAGADLSAAANQYKFVKLNTTADAVVLAASAGEKVIGVLQDTPASGEACEVVIFGITKVAAGGTYNPGTTLTTTAAGLADTATTGNERLGQAIETGTTGTIRTMFFNPFGISA